MKRIVRCLSCSKIIAYYQSYWAELEETPIIGGMRMPSQKVRGKICADCASQAGYKTKKERILEKNLTR